MTVYGQILKEVIRKRQIIIDETDGAGLDEDDGDDSVAKVPRNTSNEAVRKFEDYGQFSSQPFEYVLTVPNSEIPYISEDQVNAVTKNPQLKLMLRLIKFKIVDEGTSVFRCIAEDIDNLLRRCR